MPTKIKPDYQPSQRVYELLKAYGVQNPVEFVGHEMGAFFLYWEGTGKTKANWDSTCLNWMKRTYEDKKHQTALNRTPSDNKGNAFAKVFDDMFERPVEQIEQIQRNLKPYQRPEVAVDPTKTTEDYLDELRKFAQ